MGDLPAQYAETLANLRALLVAACGPGDLARFEALRVYYPARQ